MLHSSVGKETRQAFKDRQKGGSQFTNYFCPVTNIYFRLECISLKQAMYAANDLFDEKKWKREPYLLTSLDGCTFTVHDSVTCPRYSKQMGI